MNEADFVRRFSFLPGALLALCAPGRPGQPQSASSVHRADGVSTDSRRDQRERITSARAAIAMARATGACSWARGPGGALGVCKTGALLYAQPLRRARGHGAMGRGRAGAGGVTCRPRPRRSTTSCTLLRRRRRRESAPQSGGSGLTASRDSAHPVVASPPLRAGDLRRACALPPGARQLQGRSTRPRRLLVVVVARCHSRVVGSGGAPRDRTRARASCTSTPTARHRCPSEPDLTTALGTQPRDLGHSWAPQPVPRHRPCQRTTGRLFSPNLTWATGHGRRCDDVVWLGGVRVGPGRRGRPPPSVHYAHVYLPARGADRLRGLRDRGRGHV